MVMSMIIRNKATDILVDFVRLICLLAIITLIIYHDQNITASIILGLAATFAILLTTKTIISIESDKIKITTKRLLNLTSTHKEYYIKRVSNIEYFPTKIHPVILLLPGMGGIESAKLIIIEMNGEVHEFKMTLKDHELVALKELLKDSKR